MKSRIDTQSRLLHVWFVCCEFCTDWGYPTAHPGQGVADEMQSVLRFLPGRPLQNTLHKQGSVKQSEWGRSCIFMNSPD